MNYEALRNSISSTIKTNGEQRITGAVLQEVLLNMVSSLGQFASYSGIANPGTNPAGIDGNVFYIATAAGNYQHFGFTINTSGYYIISNLSGVWNLVRLPIAADSATYAGGISVSGYNGVELRARKIDGESDDIEIYSTDGDFRVFVYGADRADYALVAGNASNLGGLPAAQYLTKSGAEGLYQPLATAINTSNIADQHVAVADRATTATRAEEAGSSDNAANADKLGNVAASMYLQNVYTSLGSITSVTDLRNKILSWIENNLNKFAIARFSGSINWLYQWDSNDDTPIGAGQNWFIQVISAYQDTTHFALLVSSYYSTQQCIIIRDSGVWRPLQKFAYTSNIANTYQLKITDVNKLPYSLLSGTPTSLPASDVYPWAKAATKPTYTFSEITGKPTTLAGYGITDAYTKSEVNTKVAAYVPKTGDSTIDGILTATSFAIDGVISIDIDGLFPEHGDLKLGTGSTPFEQAYITSVYGTLYGTATNATQLGGVAAAQYLTKSGAEGLYQPLATAINTGNIADQHVAVADRATTATRAEYVGGSTGVSYDASAIKAIDDKFVNYLTTAAAASTYQLKITDVNKLPYSLLSGTPTLGTAASKNYADVVSNGNADLVTSQGVYSAIQAAKALIPSITGIIVMMATAENSGTLSCMTLSQQGASFDYPSDGDMIVIVNPSGINAGIDRILNEDGSVDVDGSPYLNGKGIILVYYEGKLYQATDL